MSTGIIICGSRYFNDYFIFSRFVFVCLSDLIRNNIINEHDYNKDIIIVEGGAKGADKLANRFSHAYHINHLEMKADWNTYGKSAGYKRNIEMADYVKGNCDFSVCIAFYLLNGISNGTKHMVEIAKNKNFDKVYTKGVYT